MPAKFDQNLVTEGQTGNDVIKKGTLLQLCVSSQDNAPANMDCEASTDEVNTESANCASADNEAATDTMLGNECCEDSNSSDISSLPENKDVTKSKNKKGNGKTQVIIFIKSFCFYCCAVMFKNMMKSRLLHSLIQDITNSLFSSFTFSNFHSKSLANSFICHSLTHFQRTLISKIKVVR